MKMHTKRATLAPRAMLAKKPAHGAACTQCGLCCYVVQCELSQHIFGEQPGPCPALIFDADRNSSCGLTTAAAPYGPAAAHLIRVGQGCDARFNGEARDAAFDARLDELDRNTRGATHAARNIWGMT